MTIAISTSNPQNCSIINMENEKKRLVRREVLHNVSGLVTELISQEKYFDDLSELFGQEDDEGNMPEVFEYWAVTSWLAEKLKAQGELVSEFFDLVIWGRQTTGQLICMDAVIDNIARGLFTKNDAIDPQSHTRELFAKNDGIDSQSNRPATPDPDQWVKNLYEFERLHKALMATTDPQRYKQIEQQIQAMIDADGDHD